MISITLVQTLDRYLLEKLKNLAESIDKRGIQREILIENNSLIYRTENLTETPEYIVLNNIINEIKSDLKATGHDVIWTDVPTIPISHHYVKVLITLPHHLMKYKLKDDEDYIHYDPVVSEFTKDTKDSMRRLQNNMFIAQLSLNKYNDAIKTIAENITGLQSNIDGDK